MSSANAFQYSSIASSLMSLEIERIAAAKPSRV